jgi:carbon-monoxide dehydrogenase iron sulfur subunit
LYKQYNAGGSKIKKIFALEKHCMGCRLCEIHCIVSHSQSKDIIRAFREESPRPISRIKVEEQQPISFGLQCRFCDEPLCVASCLTGAMHLDEEGLPTHEPDRCKGCGTCILFCPFGSIQMDRERGHVVAKCDMCAEEGEPACVANCPNGALILVTEEEFNELLEHEKRDREENRKAREQASKRGKGVEA